MVSQCRISICKERPGSLGGKDVNFVARQVVFIFFVEVFFLKQIENVFVFLFNN